LETEPSYINTSNASLLNVIAATTCVSGLLHANQQVYELQPCDKFNLRTWANGKTYAIMMNFEDKSWFGNSHGVERMVKIDIATTKVAPGGCGAILLSVLLHLFHIRCLFVNIHVLK
jgi:hypothetical protein